MKRDARTLTAHELERVAEMVARGAAATDTPPAAAPAELRPNGRPVAGDHADELVIRWAADVRPQRVRWAWDGRLALGTLALLVGVPGLGKSMLALLLAARLSRGRLLGDLWGEPATVLYATAEDSPEYTLAPRLHAAGADMARVGFVTLARDGIETGITLPENVDALAAAVQDTRAALLVVDPIMAHLSDGLDAHRDHSIRRALAPLHHMATDTGCAVLCVGHLNKAPSGDLFSRVGGSIGLTGAARTVLLMTPDPEREDDPDARIVVHGKSNVGPLRPALRARVKSTVAETAAGPVPTALIELGDEAPHIRVADVLRPTDPEARSAREEAKAWLHEALKDGRRPSKDILAQAKQEGIAEKTLRRAATEAGVELERVGFGPGSVVYWKLPAILAQDPGTSMDGANVAKYEEGTEAQRVTGAAGSIRGHSPSVPKYGPADDSERLWEEL